MFNGLSKTALLNISPNHFEWGKLQRKKAWTMPEIYHLDSKCQKKWQVEYSKLILFYRLLSLYSTFISGK